MVREWQRLSGWGFGVLLAAIFLATSGAHAAAPVVVGGELVGATGVNVGGVVYDVQFVDGTCVAVYDGCDDVSDFPFTTLADATLAGQALLDQVLLDYPSGDFDTFPDQVLGCAEPTICGAQTPFALPDATSVKATSAINTAIEENESVSDFDWDRTWDTGIDDLGEFGHWVIWTPVPPATPIVELGKLTGATNVNVGGTLYDVEFVEGTCADVYHGCDVVTDFDFQTEAEATAAANALLDQVLLDTGAGSFDSFPDQVFGCLNPTVCGAQTPFALPDAVNVTIASAVNSIAETNDSASVLDWDKALHTGTDSLNEFAMWVIWTPVPTATPVVVANELKGATNVSVGGLLYDVDFVEGTCADVYDGCDAVSDFPFPTEAEALEAAWALVDHVLRDTPAGDFDSFPDQVFGCAHPAICGVQNPFALPDAVNVTIASAINSTNPLADAPAILDWEKALHTGTDSLSEFAVWAVWALVGNDSDGDGVLDATDNCPSIPNAGQEDADADGVGDVCDICPGHDDGLDTDGDGVPDGCDVCPGGDDGIDGDGDGVPDFCDVCPGSDDNVDGDADTIPDGCDNCPSDANLDQADTDADNVGDVCDVCPGSDDTQDADGDAVPDGCDNCPAAANAGQEDADGDTVGDACDICPGFSDLVDNDGDGVPNACDNCLNDANAGQEDADTDNVGDVCDNCPNVPNQFQFDQDGDGHGNACDNCKLIDNEDQADGDGDTVGDVCDNCPVDANLDQADADTDTVGDVCDICPDGDDLVDGDADTVPDDCDNCPVDANPGQENADGDNAGDVCDVCAPDGNPNLVAVTFDGILTYVPPGIPFVMSGDPFSMDVIIDTSTPNEVAPPDYEGTSPGTAGAVVIVAVAGHLDHVAVDSGAGEWQASGRMATALLAGTIMGFDVVITSPNHTGVVPDWQPGTSTGTGAVSLFPLTAEELLFDINDVTVTPTVDPSADSRDVDKDGIFNDCDPCILDPDNDGDGDGVCGATLDNCEYIANPSQADGDGDGNGDACEGISFDDAYADSGHGSDPATYYQVSDDLTISGTYFGVVDGVSNGDVGGFGIEGTNGPAVLGTNQGALNSPTFTWGTDVQQVVMDVGLANGDGGQVTATAYDDGLEVDSVTIQLNDTNLGEGLFSTFNLTGPLDEITVEAFNTNDSMFLDTFVDNIVVVPVPEPGTLLSLLFGAGYLGVLARRRER